MNKLLEEFILKRLRNNETFRYYFFLSLSLCTIIASIYIWWPIAGKAPVELWDGQSQHFLSFVYFGEYVRELLKNIFIEHSFSIPTYDFSIGYGQDIIGTLHYYIIGDPFSILAIFAKPNHAEFAFFAGILLRIFFSGISMSIFLRSKKIANYQSYIATFIYVFSGFLISAASRHPYFINPMIYLPLLCLGVDHIFNKKSGKLFAFMTFISVVSNFYFLYMLTLLVFLYAVYSYINLYSIKNYKLLLYLLGKSIANYLLGIMMGAVIFLPVVNQFFNTGRSGIGPTTERLYTKTFYLNFFKNFISPVFGAEAWTITAFSPLVIIIFACILYQTSKKKKFAIIDLCSVSLLTLFLLLPIFGSFFNGFSYSANRWIFGYTFFLSLLTAKYLPFLIDLTSDFSKRNKLERITFITLFFAALFLLINYKREVPPFIGLLFLLLYLIILLLFNDSYKTKFSLCLLVLLNAVVFGAFQSNLYINPGMYNNYTTKNIVQNDYWAPKSSAIAEISKSDIQWHRYELFKSGSSRSEVNNAIIRRTNSTNFYFSLSNKNTFLFNQAIENNINSDYEYFGLDNRAELGTLANSKYYAKLASESNQDIPFGYTYLKTLTKEDEPVEIYLNTNFLPFGFTYDSYIIQKEKEKNSLTIMESLPKSAIVDKPIDGLKEKSFTDNENQKLKYQISHTDGVEIEGDKYIVSKTNASLTLTIESLPQGTNNYLFLRLKDIDYPNTHPRFFGTSQTETNIKANYADLTKQFNYRNQYQGWYVGIENVLLNLGKINQEKEVNLSFDKPGIYSFDSINLYTRDYTNLSDHSNKLKEDTLQDVKFSANKVSGNIDLDSQKLLLLTIPYEKGWTAYSDGREIPIVRANYMYSGLVLKPGSHNIELVYHTPGLNLGLIMTIIGWFLFIFIFLYKKVSLLNLTK